MSYDFMKLQNERIQKFATFELCIFLENIRETFLARKT